MLTWHLVTQSIPTLASYIIDSDEIAIGDLKMNGNVTQRINALTAQSIVTLVLDPFTLRLLIDRHVTSTVYENPCSNEKLLDN